MRIIAELKASSLEQKGFKKVRKWDKNGLEWSIEADIRLNPDSARGEDASIPDLLRVSNGHAASVGVSGKSQKLTQLNQGEIMLIEEQSSKGGLTAEGLL